MKACFVSLVLVGLAAQSLAQVGGSEGVQCLNKCLGSDATGTSVASSAFHRTALRSSTLADDPACQYEKILTCVEDCQVDAFVAIAREARRTLQKYCGDSVDEATEKKFFNDIQHFQTAWAEEQLKCPQDWTTVEELCKIYSCVFGSALTTAEINFDSDVVSLTVNAYKINSGVDLADNESLPSSCNVLFQPYESSNYPTYPSYPSYQSSNYQPYQRSGHQHYQRSKYRYNHRNGYRTYQRGGYQRRN